MTADAYAAGDEFVRSRPVAGHDDRRSLDIRRALDGHAPTLLTPEDCRDRANGLVGTVTGVSFAIASVFSDLVIGRLGMASEQVASGVDEPLLVRS